MAKREAIARDKNYDLVSVLYHALQGDETLDRYIEDAEDAEDSELAAHFRHVQQAYRDIARETKELLREKLFASEGEEDEEDQDEAEETE